MSSFSGKKKNAVYPSDNSLSVPNGAHADIKKKSAPKIKPLDRKPSKLWTEEIQALKSCENFYVKQTNLQTEQTFSPSYYDIRNAKGKLTFKAIESVDPAIRDLYHSKQDKGKPPYVITIFDMKAGKEMLRINANLRQGVMLVYVKQSTEDKIIGIVRRNHPRCPQFATSTFSLERPNGAVLLKIQSSFSLRNALQCCKCRRFVTNQGKSFRILMADDVTHVGEVRYVQKQFEEKDDEESNRREEMVTAEFPGDTTATNKALVLASLFMLDNLYFQHKRRIRERPKISKTCYIVLVIVSLVVLIGVLAAVFGGGGYQGNKTTGGGRRPGLG